MIVAVQPERGHVALSMKVQETNKVDELFDASKVDELMSRPLSTGSVDFLEGEGPGSEELQHVSRDASLSVHKRGRSLRQGSSSRSGVGCLLGCLMLVGFAQQSANLPDHTQAIPIVGPCLIKGKDQADQILLRQAYEAHT